MPIDGIFYSHLVDELRIALDGSRVDKIHHPTRHEFLLAMRRWEGSKRLLFSLNPLRAHVNLTEQRFENPAQPSMLCMLLRKRLTGAALAGIDQEGLDRILYFRFNGTDDIGEPAAHTLVAELFGRRPNLILLDSQGLVIDALKRADFTHTRPIWPGIMYTPPPARNQESGIRNQDIAPYETYSQFLDACYGEADQAQRLKQKTASLQQLLSGRTARLRKKIVLQRQELARAENREELRIKAELILANKARLERDPAARGSGAYVLENYYDDNRVVSIQVNPALGPGANAQRLFKAYQKAKNAASLLGDLIARGEEQLQYLESVEELLARAQTQPEIDALRMELESQGFCKPQASAKRKQKQSVLPPLEYFTSEKFKILVGRNNLQNDQLSLKMAKASDLWFHAQGYPGSHVILCAENQEPGEASILQSAKVAAWHSKARGAAVQVDYTSARALKKPKGSPPGKVIYHTYKTIIASATQDEIEGLTGGNMLGRH